MNPLNFIQMKSYCMSYSTGFFSLHIIFVSFVDNSGICISILVNTFIIISSFNISVLHFFRHYPLVPSKINEKLAYLHFPTCNSSQKSSCIVCMFSFFVNIFCFLISPLSFLVLKSKNVHHLYGQANFEIF